MTYPPDHPLLRCGGINPPMKLAHSVVHFDDLRPLDPGEQRRIHLEPQVPFKGEWFFTDDASAALWIHGLQVGNISVLPCGYPLPATFWSTDAYVAALRDLGLATNAARMKEIMRHPLFERLKLTFPVCSVGSIIVVVVENRGGVQATFKGTIAGKALFSDGELDDPVVRGHAWASDVPDVAIGLTSGRSVSTPTLNEIRRSMPEASEPALLERPEPESVPAPGARELARPCWYCNAGVDQPCHGLPRGQVHKRRIQ